MFNVLEKYLLFVLEISGLLHPDQTSNGPTSGGTEDPEQCLHITGRDGEGPQPDCYKCKDLQ